MGVIREGNGTERLRTTWTPQMDRYFIDLLVEQVTEVGNKFEDQLLSKRAWKHMTALFNSEFKSQFEKDVLKNRFKTLRNQYKAVKKLLDHDGFSWDESRQMVTAHNSVWDDYLRSHRDARSFRVKTVPFADLRLIYGGSAETVDNEGGGGGGGEVKEAAAVVVDNNARQERRQNGRVRTNWLPPMDRYFIDLMMEQMEKGNQIDGVFRKQAWMEMIAAFNAKFEFNYDVEILKNRYKTLRRQCKSIKNLLAVNGFAWDDTREMVTADDSVWQDYIKTHSDARQFMTRPIPYYKDLCRICNDPSIDESDGFSAEFLDLPVDLQEVKFQGMSQSSQSPAFSAFAEELVGDMLDLTHTGAKTVACNQNSKRQLENHGDTLLPKRLRGEQEDGMASALREMAAAVSSLTEKRKDEKDENLSSFSIENVVEAVQALPDMDEDLILDACDLLEDEVKAKTFMTLDVKLRKKWLLRKLRPES